MGNSYSRTRGVRGAMVRGKIRRASTLVNGVAVLALAGAGPVAASAQQAAAAVSLVFDGVTVVDVESGKLLPAQRVVIAGNRIQTVGPVGTVAMPQGAQVVDARGKYLIPGLWDLHTHAMRYTDFFYPLFLANGVTGIRDAWSMVPLDTLRQWRQEILAGTRVGPPRQILTGPPLRGSWDRARVRYLIDSLKAAGVDMIKAVMGYDLVADARQLGIPVGGHADDVDDVAISDSGAVIIDHVIHSVGTHGRIYQSCWTEGQQATSAVDPFPSIEQCQAVAQRLRHNNTWWVPTLTIYHALAQNRTPPGQRALPITARFHDYAQAFWAGAPRYSNWLRDSAETVSETLSRDSTAGAMRLLQQVGLPLLAGSDAATELMRSMPPGFSLHAELAMYVAEGLTPLAALQAATLNPAKMLRGTDSLGAVAPGKLADLVLLDADPLVDITNTTAIRAVVANGRYFARAALDGMFAEIQAKAKTEPAPLGEARGKNRDPALERAPRPARRGPR